MSLSTKIAGEAQHGLIAQVIKNVIFSMRPANKAQPDPDTKQIAEVIDAAVLIG
jgi:COP9 signalosome complex subunit 5